MIQSLWMLKVVDDSRANNDKIVIPRYKRTLFGNIRTDIGYERRAPAILIKTSDVSGGTAGVYFKVD